MSAMTNLLPAVCLSILKLLPLIFEFLFLLVCSYYCLICSGLRQPMYTYFAVCFIICFSRDNEGSCYKFLLAPSIGRFSTCESVRNS